MGGFHILKHFSNHEAMGPPVWYCRLGKGSASYHKMNWNVFSPILVSR